MRQCVAFQTFDGKVFLGKEDASRHENSMTFEKWYKDHTLYNGVYPIDVEDMRDYLKEVLPELIELLIRNKL